MFRPSLTLLIAVSLVVAKGAARTNSDAAMPKPDIRATENALQAFHVTNPDESLPYNIPRATRPLLTKVKHELRDIIGTELNSERGATPANLTADVINKLHDMGVPVGGKNLPKSQAYGGILSVKIQHPHGYPQLLAATTSLQIPCSGRGDTSLYIFQRHGAKWNLVIAVERNGYRGVNEGLDVFKYSILPVGGGRDWYVVTAGIPSWCTSCWSGGVDYMVLQPGPTPENYRILRKGNEPAYKCVDPPFELTPNLGGFSLKYTAGEWLDFSLFTTPHTDHFAVSGSTVTRIGPLGENPQDFLNAWVQLPWNEASRWSNQKNLTSLKKWHKRLQPNSNYVGTGKFQFVKACNDPPTKWQVGLNTGSENPLDSELFFTISKKGQKHLLDRIETVRPRRCVGKTLPIKASGWNVPPGR